MKTILTIISGACAAAFGALELDPALGKASVSNRPDLCEYQCNSAMAAAKRYGKKPIELAQAAAEQLKLARYEGELLFSACEAVMPGFINMKLSEAFLNRYLADMSEDAGLGLSAPEQPQTIIIDYGGANVAKPLHVGHLRSAVIGESVKRLARRMGHKVIADVHLGDWGLQMGLIIAELEDRGRLNEPFTISELEEIYPAASARAKAKNEAGELQNPEFAERAHEATVRLQQGEPGYRRVWERIMEVSVEDLKKNYASLQVSFDLWKGESDAQPYIPGLIEQLEQSGLAYSSEGALVVDIAEPGDSKELPPCLIRKSDGAALYATSDLGTIIERERLYQPDRYIYVTDARQALHFTQVFRVARKAGFVPMERELTHIGFGTMNGKDGKPFKTRDGGVLRLERLIADTNEEVYKRIRGSRGEGMSEAEAREVATIVGLAALKYGDLSNQAAKDYVFDLERFTAFEGNTGPYLLYTIVRIKSILGRYAAAEGLDETALAERLRAAEAVTTEADCVRALKLCLARYQDVMQAVWAELAPHRLCAYTYELANAFNSFYHEVKILGEEDEARRLSYLGLLQLTKSVLLDCIQVLGFEAPERM